MTRRAGFSLLEVVAAAALMGILVTFVAPSVKGSFDKVKNSKLRNDLISVGQAVQVYQMEKGAYPESLQKLFEDKYVNTDEFKDAKGSAFTYSSADGTVSGQTTDSKTVTFNGYKLVESTETNGD